jgi:hypothetical protein
MLIAAVRDYHKSIINRAELRTAGSVARRVLRDAESFLNTIEK